MITIHSSECTRATTIGTPPVQLTGVLVPGLADPHLEEVAAGQQVGALQVPGEVVDGAVGADRVLQLPARLQQLQGRGISC